MKSLLMNKACAYGRYKCSLSMSLKEIKVILSGDNDVLHDHLKKCIKALEKLPNNSTTVRVDEK